MQNPAPGFAPVGITSHPMEFSGSGGEYFRVWIVNVLLTIVTLGIYTPWARRRTAMYFYGHTVVAGSALEFTAQQRKMVMGFLLFAGLFVAYQIAAETGQHVVVSVFLLAGAVLAPWIWASAMRFRLGATRWRGLSLRFAANWREVYVASWPVFAIAFIWIGFIFGMGVIVPEWAAAVGEMEETRARPSAPPAIVWVLLALAWVSTVLCIIRLEYNYKSLLVRRAHVGVESGRWKPVYFDFVKIWLAMIGVFILTFLVIGIVISVFVGGSFALVAALAQQSVIWRILLVFVGVMLAIFLAVTASAPARAYREARMFRLMWDNIGVSQIARFKCDLRTSAYVWLRVKNLFLTLVTLGFYRPFARVSEYQMKVESVTLHVKGGVDQLAGMLQRQQQDGIGDALADAAGLDLIG